MSPPAEITIGSIWYARFTPATTDDLKAWALPYLGHRMQWSAAWIIEEGPYSGEWAMAGREDGFWGWVPARDLSEWDQQTDLFAGPRGLIDRQVWPATRQNLGAHL